MYFSNYISEKNLSGMKLSKSELLQSFKPKGSGKRRLNLPLRLIMIIVVVIMLLKLLLMMMKMIVLLLLMMMTIIAKL